MQKSIRTEMKKVSSHLDQSLKKEMEENVMKTMKELKSESQEDQDLIKELKSEVVHVFHKVGILFA